MCSIIIIVIKSTDCTVLASTEPVPVYSFTCIKEYSRMKLVLKNAWACIALQPSHQHPQGFSFNITIDTSHVHYRLDNYYIIIMIVCTFFGILTILNALKFGLVHGINFVWMSSGLCCLLHWCFFHYWALPGYLDSLLSTRTPQRLLGYSLYSILSR